MFTACFVITEKCNLHCDYCYMNNNDIFMTKDTFKHHYHKNLPYFLNQYNQQKYNLDLFGGEPLLNWNLIEYINEYVKNDKNCTLNILTNGTLLDNYKVDYIKKNNINTSISFDGLWSEKLELYIKKLNLIKKLVNNVNVCVTPKNIEMSKNYEYMIEHFNILPNFKIVRDNIWEDKDVEIFKIELNKLIKSYIKFLAKSKNYLPGLIKYNLSLMIESTLHDMNKTRCFAGNNGVAFSIDGKVYPCARFLTNDSYVLYDGNNYVEKNIKKINKLSNTFSKNCDICSINSYCNYMCLQQEIKNGLSSNLCKIYQILSDKIIEINNKFKSNKFWMTEVYNIYNNVRENNG